MSDLEITRLCAESIGLKQYTEGGIPQDSSEHSIYVWDDRRDCNYSNYDPLHDDAQAMALVKKFRLNIAYIGIKETDETRSVEWWCMDVSQKCEAPGDTPNRAICECVANMQKPLP